MEQAISTFISLLDSDIKRYERRIHEAESQKKFDRAAFLQTKLDTLTEIRSMYDICIENAAS